MSVTETEYRALTQLRKSDKRFRLIAYILLFIVFLFVCSLLLSIKQQNDKTYEATINKIDELVESARARNDARAADQKVIAQETIRYNTCIILLPVNERTPSAQQDCFDKANLPGGLERQDFSTLSVIKKNEDQTIATQGGETQNPDSLFFSFSYPNNNSGTDTKPSESSQATEFPARTKPEDQPSNTPASVLEPLVGLSEQCLVIELR